MSDDARPPAEEITTSDASLQARAQSPLTTESSSAPHDTNTTRTMSASAAPAVERGDTSDGAPIRPAQSSVALERTVKRPRQPDPITASLVPPLVTHTVKAARPELPTATPLSSLEGSRSHARLSLTPPAPMTTLARPPSPPHVKVPVKLPCKTPVTTPGGVSPHSGSSFLSAPSLPSRPLSTTSTPLTRSPLSIVTTPSTPQPTTLHERWVAMLVKAFMLDCGADESERVAEVSGRIVASIPGSKAVAADTFLMLKANLADEKNGALRQQVLTGRLPVELLVTLNEKDLVNPERRKELEEGFQERAKDRNITEMIKASQTTSTMFPCPSCRVRDCTWMQKQTRSADEPMTVFCTCNRCGYRWRRF